MKTFKPVHIVGSARIPFAKSLTHYSDFTRQQLMVGALTPLISKFGLQGKKVGDVALGAVMNSSAEYNLARECVLDTELHPETPAYNVQRACGTSLETAWQLSLKIAAGQMDVGIAGGVDTNSDLPIEVSPALKKSLLTSSQARDLLGRITPFFKVGPRDLIPVPPAVVERRTLLSMGQHCELMVKEWNIPRADQDELALRSHRNGAAAYEKGFYSDLVYAFGGLEKDPLLRPDTSLEKLAKLKPAFDKEKGTLTAGNSSPLTDGAACVLLASDEGCSKNGWTPLARLIDFQVAAVDFVHGAGLLMAPTLAVSQMLERNKLTFADFDFFEIHEAFAGQVLCTLRAWESDDYCKRVLGRKSPMGSIPISKLNTVGSSVALGHPFAATGARITGTLGKLLGQAGPGKRGLISICTAGGMGVCAIAES